MEKMPVALGRPRLELLTESERLPRRLPLLLRLAIRYGIGHANRVLRNRGNLIEIHAPEEGLMRLMGGNPSFAVQRAIMAGYLHGAIQVARELSDANREADFLRGVWGALQQRELIWLMLAVAPEDAQDLRAWSEAMDTDYHSWTTHISGALAVARLVYAFSRLRAEVYFPLPLEDKRGIDLIVDLPGGHGGVCLQVKGCGKEVSSSITTIAWQSSSEFRYLLSGVAEFSEHVLGDWRAALAQIGLEGI
ncbi:MAG: hypothetical protein V1821_00675, partial [bacterium]